MVALSSPFCDLSDPHNYLEDAKVFLAPDKSKLRLFLQDVDRLTQHLRFSSDTHFPHSHIHSIANGLRFAPRLLYGLNCMLRPRYRLECLTSCSHVNHYVFVEGNNSWIYSFIPNRQLPSSSIDVRDLIKSRDGWNRMLDAEPDDEWLACLAQVVQEILDDPTTNVSFLPAARKRLIRLSQRGIIPPSIFFHFPSSVQPSDYAGKAEYIASGGFCDVYKFVDGNSSSCFRVLRRPEDVEEFKFRADFCQEVVVWRQLKHPNILDFIGVTVEIYTKRYCFVLPWLSHGSIMNYLRKHPDHDRFASVGQIIDGVHYLHNLDPPVSHKDIKGANVLVRNDLVCVLTDFGNSNILDSQRSKDSFGNGTWFWMAPEMFGSDPLDRDARPRDIYSLGCTIFEIYTGKPPSEIMPAVLKGKAPTLPPEGQPWTEEEIELWIYVGLCLDVNPEERPDIKLLRNALSDVKKWSESFSLPTEHTLEKIIPPDITAMETPKKLDLSLTTFWQYFSSTISRLRTKTKRDVVEVGSNPGPSFPAG